MVTILGAGGAIGDELVKRLAARHQPIRLVSRNPKLVPGATEAVAADLSRLDDAVRAVAGATIAFLVVGLKYDLKVWRELWPRIMRNTIEAAKRARARLIFFGNVYMYGKVDGPMTEGTPFRPCSRKGEIRAQIARVLLDEIKAGNLTALIARAADFYGPRVRTGLPNVLVFDRFAKGAKAMWLANDAVKHSFTFTPDAAHGLVILAEAERAWNQTWHLPTAPDPPTGRGFIELAAKEFAIQPRYRVLKRPLIKIAGWFDTTIRELYEMLYQYEFDYIFDSTKFDRAFGFQPTSYAEGIHRTAQEYRLSKSPGSATRPAIDPGEMLLPSEGTCEAWNERWGWSIDTWLRTIARVATRRPVLPAFEGCPNPPHTGDPDHSMETHRVLRAPASPRIVQSRFQFREFDRVEPGKSPIPRSLQSGYGHRGQRGRALELFLLVRWANRCRRDWHRQEFAVLEKDGSGRLPWKSVARMPLQSDQPAWSRL